MRNFYRNRQQLNSSIYRGILKGAESPQKGQNMYEVVKIVKGYEITRMKGTKGAYHVTVREFHTFKTIKAAAEFIEKTL